MRASVEIVSKYASQKLIIPELVYSYIETRTDTDPTSTDYQKQRIYSLNKYDNDNLYANHHKCMIIWISCVLYNQNEKISS